MEEEKITLDSKTFKTLASETRINILKSLDRRRKTLSELSKESGMSVSTIKEHLDNLALAELVVQKDEGHKWKYYELTRKAKSILHPDMTKIWIIVVTSSIAVIGIIYDFAQRFFSFAMGGSVFRAPLLAANTASEAAQKAAETDLVQQTIQTTPFLHILGLVVLSIIIGFAVGYGFYKKKRTTVI